MVVAWRGAGGEAGGGEREGAREILLSHQLRQEWPGEGEEEGARDGVAVAVVSLPQQLMKK